MRNKKLSIDELSKNILDLSRARAAVKLYIMPFRNTAHVEVRQSGTRSKPAHVWPWKIRDWAWNEVLPRVVHSMGRVIPLSRIRDPLIDTVNEAAQVLGNGLGDLGSNSAEQTGQFKALTRDDKPQRIKYCTWMFPACQFGAVLRAFRDFCEQHYRTSKFRCDLPVIAYRIDRDPSAVLSPTFDEKCFALNVRTTDTRGWDDFLLEFAEFAIGFAGIPLFNQTRGFTGSYVDDVYGERLAQFRALRKRLDPEDRVLNQFFAEQVG
jgi:hypothetical protein